MACCIIGALILSQVLAFWRRVKAAWGMIWLLTSIALGVGLLSFGFSERGWMSTATDPIAWCRR